MVEMIVVQDEDFVKQDGTPGAGSRCWRCNRVINGREGKACPHCGCWSHWPPIHRIVLEEMLTKRLAEPPPEWYEEELYKRLRKTYRPTETEADVQAMERMHQRLTIPIPDALYNKYRRYKENFSGLFGTEHNNLPGVFGLQIGDSAVGFGDQHANAADQEEREDMYGGSGIDESANGASSSAGLLSAAQPSLSLSDLMVFSNRLAARDKVATASKASRAQSASNLPKEAFAMAFPLKRCSFDNPESWPEDHLELAKSDVVAGEVCVAK